MMTPDDIDVWVGLDVGKSAHHAHALDHDGNTLYDKPLKQDEKAIRTMLGKLSKHGRVLLVVDQPNTIGSLPLTVARNMGIAVAYLPGTAMRRTAQLLPGDAKTDRRDAHVIAWAGIEDVKDWAKSNGLRAGRIIDDMFKAIGEQTVTVPGTLMAETIIPSIAHDIKTIRDRRREVGRQVEKLLEDHPLLTVLTSMPGIGVRTASNILLGIGGDIANFKSSAHLAAYAGISPVTGQSGTSIKGERPSRRGNKRLKNALWQTAFVASTKHPPSVAYYKRKREQGKHHNAAIICLARRRCDVIYSMLKNGTLYQEPALVA